MTYLHKFKCLHCRLHFIVCSYKENWPHENDNNTGSSKVYCPECGKDGRRLVWKEAVDKQIFDVMPGNTATFMQDQSKL